MPKLAGRLAGVLEEGFTHLEALPIWCELCHQHHAANTSRGVCVRGRRLGQPGELTQQVQRREGIMQPYTRRS